MPEKRSDTAKPSAIERLIRPKYDDMSGTHAIAIQRYCVGVGVPCWDGGMLESNVGQDVSVALATLPGMAYAADIFPAGRLYPVDLADPDSTLSAPGTITAHDRPGHGFALDTDRLCSCKMSVGKTAT